MLDNAKEKVIAGIRTFVNGADFSRVEKSKPLIAEQIKNIKVQDLIFGEETNATFFRGYFEGNVRSDGRKTSGDFTSSRTLNFDFTTKTIGFVDDDNTADENAVRIAAELLGMHMYNLGAAKFSHFEQLGSEIYRQNESNFALVRNVFPQCEYEHKKLGYYLDSDSIDILHAEFFREQSAKIPICAVYANLTDKKGRTAKTLLGYYAEIHGNGDELSGVFLMDAENLLGKKKNNNGVKPKGKLSIGKIIKWLIIGFITIDVIGTVIAMLAK